MRFEDLAVTSGVVRPELLAGTIDSHRAAVGQDPLRPGVAEGHSDEYDCLGVVQLNGLDRHVTLLRSTGSTLLWARTHLEAGGRGPCHQDSFHRSQEASLAE